MNEAQVCYRCGHAKARAGFVQRVDDRHFNMCRVCVTEILSMREGKPKVRLRHTDTHRTCYLCRRMLPVDSYTRRSNGSYFSGCKDCNRCVFAVRRRARRAVAGGSFSRAEWEALLAQYERCPMCQRPWEDIPRLPSRSSVATADHIVSLLRGGSSSIDNIQPLCYSCNSRKGGT